jgi:hypothetical protein
MREDGLPGSTIGADDVLDILAGEDEDDGEDGDALDVLGDGL